MSDVDPIDHSRLALAKEKWEAELTSLAELPCETPEHQRWWSESVLPTVQSAIKDIEDDRVSITKPINVDLRRINKEFAAYAEPAEKVKALVLGKLKAFAEASRAAERAALAEAARLAAVGETEACQDALAALPEPVKVAGARTTWVWAIESVDEATLPDWAWRVDVPALEAHADVHKASETIPPIPGVVYRRVAMVAPTGRR